MLRSFKTVGLCLVACSMFGSTAIAGIDEIREQLIENAQNRYQLSDSIQQQCYRAGSVAAAYEAAGDFGNAEGWRDQGRADCAEADELRQAGN